MAHESFLGEYPWGTQDTGQQGVVENFLILSKLNKIILNQLEIIGGVFF